MNKPHNDDNEGRESLLFVIVLITSLAFCIVVVGVAARSFGTGLVFGGILWLLFAAVIAGHLDA